MATTDLVDRDTELKPFLEIATADGAKNTLLDLLSDTARALIESYLDRLLVTRGSITEFHSIWRPQSAIYLTQWPIIPTAGDVTSVHEDANGSYDASALLTVTTDYTISAPAGKIIRVSSAVATTWLAGYRTIQVIYTGGYADTASVPADIKYECLRIIGAMWSEASMKQFNMSSIADDLGNVSRFVPPGVNADARRALDGYRRMEQSPTGAVDA